MIRTQISLDKTGYDLAKQEAGALGISVAEFVRRAVRATLTVAGQGRWMKYAGFVASGDPHTPANRSTTSFMSRRTGQSSHRDAHGLVIMRDRRNAICWSTDRHLSLTGIRLAIPT